MDLQRRRSPRIAMDWAVSVEAPTGVHCGTMKNLSLHGIFVRMGERVALGESVTISFHDPGERPFRSVRIAAVVIRNDKEGVALALRQMDLDSFILLRGIIGTRTADA